MVTKTQLLPLALSALFAASVAQAQGPDPRFDMGRDQYRVSEQMQSEPIYGQEVMTNWEVQQHRTTLRSLPTEQARKAYLEQHRQRVEERASGMGIELVAEEEASYPGWDWQTMDRETLMRHSETNHRGP